MEQDYLIDDGLVERLHAALAEALKRTRTDPFVTPVTVAEIYQDLVPYRIVRTMLGFQMNADYEHTLLRLLAGESGLARLEPAEAKDELKVELETPNPNVGLFRKFAACDVWIEPSEITLETFDPEPASPPAAAAAPPASMVPPAAAPAPAAPVAPPAMPVQEPAVAPAPRPRSEPAVAPARKPRSVPEPKPQAAPQAPTPMAEQDTPDAAQPGPAADLPQLEVEAVDAAETADAEWQEAVWAEPAAEGDWGNAEGELLLEEEVQPQDARPDTSLEPAAAGNDKTRQQREAAVMFDSNQSQSSAATLAAGTCAFCQGSLPGGRVVKYCPFCGADQATNPCPSCREPLDPQWKFCISCGHQKA